MHDGIQYDQIQCQGRGYDPFIVGNPWIFDICPSFFVSRDFEIGRNVSREESTVSLVWG